MTMLMDNNKENSTRERVQRLFNKNAELENKRRKAAQARVPSDPNTWQNMRENYEAIILEDHAFSEQHDVEYALWQLHYRRIEELRALFNASLASAGSQNGKGPVRAGPDRLSKIRSQFKTFLSEATGFYHDLMLKIRAKYGLPLGHFSDDPDSQMPMSKDGNKSSDVKKGLISCHRCLIYLGDLARYKSLYGEGDSKARDFAAASSYYMQASSIWPSSGNPHHQLAILAGYSNDELLSVYRYFRSLALDNPFITARDNLIIAFEKNRQSYTQLLGDVKPPTVKTTPSRLPAKGRGKGETRSPFKDNKVEANAVKEKSSNNFDLFKAFVTRFVRLNGILFTRTSLETFAEVFTMVKKDLLELLSSGPHEAVNFGSDAAECRLAIVRMVAILIFTVHNVNRESENQSYADILQRSVLLQNAFTATFEFMGCMLERCTLLTDPSSSYLLPGIMVFVEWLACRQDVAVGSEMEEKQVNARSFFWNRCISFLNKLLSSGYVFINKDEDETCFSNMSKYDESETANRLALPEDFELRGFIPLVPAQLILDFSRNHSVGGEGGNKEKMARVQRIIAAGKALANIVRNGQEGVYFDTKEKKFVFGAEPQSFDDYLLEPSLSVGSLDVSVGAQVVSKAEVDMEDEDEDEVILFKPPTMEKHIDGFTSKLTSFGEIDSRNENRSSVANDSFLLQGASSANLKPSDTVANDTPQYLQPAQPNVSNWPVEQHTPIVNGLAHLNLVENGPLLKPDLQDNMFGVSQPASFSIPYPQFLSAGNSQNYSVQIPQAPVPSRFDSIVSSGASVDGLSLKPSSIMPPGSKKNPVGRPVRHFGPPPGFGSFPSKPATDEPLYNNMAFKNENPPIPQMDDYSWLDGYHHLSSSNQSVGFSSSMNQVGPTAFPSASKSNGPMEIANFPFPGKQVPAAQVQSEKQKGWQDYHFAGQMKQYEEQQYQQLQNGNQQSGGSPQQYQGQSLWEGRFYVVIDLMQQMSCPWLDAVTRSIAVCRMANHVPSLPDWLSGAYDSNRSVRRFYKLGCGSLVRRKTVAEVTAGMKTSFGIKVGTKRCFKKRAVAGTPNR
ncbi:protein smg7 [Phtheirospermum japonicum]|uniref:Protein smg7 n=1 Tax=Phtheirospermum japonicum TaxID=374723 RepID=A0A830C1K5_9LAMI|nr:protein smg7 [Phtheirospermum japonicum]